MGLATHATEDAARAVKEAAKSVEAEIRTTGEKAYVTARSEAERLAAERRDGVASYAHDISDALEAASATLDERGRRTAAGLTRRLADELDALSGRVQGQDVGGLLHSVEDFARRRPVLFLGGAFLIGFGLIRYFGAAAGSDGNSLGQDNGAVGDSTDAQAFV